MTTNIFSLDGKVALVTGAGSGLGERFAKVLAENGASVVCVARRKEKLDKVAADIAEAGGKALAVAGDVSDRASVEAAFDAAEAEFGVVDILVNCAGVQSTADTLEMKDEDFTSILDINVNGLWRTAQICAQRLANAGKPGSIINIASILGVSARAGMVNYCSSKAAVLHMTKTMALDLIGKGIRVNAIAPGYCVTELTAWFLETPEGKAAEAGLPIGRFGNLEELDGPLLLLASDAGSYMAGTTLIVDAGHSGKIAE
ncbi:MAG: SDR family NAD(P)-dependent oxidoreductase [bacterium]